MGSMQNRPLNSLLYNRHLQKNLRARGVCGFFFLLFGWFGFLTLVKEVIQLKFKHIKTEFMHP